jgi:hypothetical protein
MALDAAREHGRIAERQREARTLANLPRIRRNVEEQARQAVPGLLDCIAGVFEAFQTTYGIPKAASDWLLHRAPYRPPAARWVDLPATVALPAMRIPTAWRREDLDVAAKEFAAGCSQVSACYWSHPEVAGRFKLRQPMTH